MTSSPCLISLCGQEPKFYVIIERKVLCETSLFVQAVFLLLSSYYVFHLSYPDKRKSFIMYNDYCIITEITLLL